MHDAPIASEWKPQRPFQDRAFLVVFIPFLAALLIFLVFFLLIEHIPGGSFEKRGQFGDAFGVLNSLYSGLGFAGVVATLYFQQVQIKKQGEETKRQFLDAAERSYEDNLYRTLDVYRATLESVIQKNGDVKIEMTYFFFIALGFSAEGELRQLLRRSGVLKLMGAAKKSEIHTEMFKRYWGFDLHNSGVKREFPIPGHRIKLLTKREKTIRARLLDAACANDQRPFKPSC